MMKSSCKKILIDKDGCLLGFQDVTYNPEKNTNNIECIDIVIENDKIKSIKFGYYSGYKFIECPIWIGNVLVHNLKYYEGGYQLGFSFRIDELLSYTTLNVKTKVLSEDDSLKHLTQLVNFTRYFIITKSKHSFVGNVLRDFEKSDFSSLPYNYTLDNLFERLHNMEVVLINEDISTCQLHIKNFGEYENYYLTTIVKILSNQLRLQDFSLDDNLGLIVNINKERFIKDNFKKNIQYQVIASLTKEFIMFYWIHYFNENEFFYSVFESVNDPEIADSLLRLTLLF